MKRYLLIGLLLIHAACAFCKSPQGLCVDHGNMYYFMDKKLYCQQIMTDKILDVYAPNEDSLLVKTLADHVIGVYGITADSSKTIARKRIARFFVLNLSFHHGRLFMGIRFRTENRKDEKPRYALLEFDRQMVFRNFYLLEVPELFVFPIYHPLKFRNEHQVYMPAYNQPGMRMGYKEYTMDSVKHRIYAGTSLVNKLDIYKYDLIVNGILVGPQIYNLSVAAPFYFYNHPFPVIYNQEGETVYDPYLSQRRNDSIDRDIKNKNRSWDFSSDLGFTAVRNAYQHVVLAAYMSDSTIHLAVSNKDPEKTDRVKINLRTGETSIHTLPLKTSLNHSFFIFSGKDLYILDFSKEKAFITVVVVEN